MSKKPATVERNIYFYRADVGFQSGRPIQLDLEPTLKSIGALDFDSGTTRYWEQPSGDSVSVWPESSNWSRFSLASVRRTGLPRAERKGKLKAVPLRPDEGLHEPIHLVSFPDNILGVEFNFYGPRPSRLSGYLQHATEGMSPPFTLEPLLRQDVAAQLAKQQELRVVELQVHAAYARRLADGQSRLGRALDAAADLSDAQVVGVVLRPEPHGRRSLGSQIRQAVSGVANRNDMRENTVRFYVKGVNGDTGEVDELNLLEDKLVSRQELVTIGNNSRAIKSSSAFEAIEAAYDELRDELKLAASVGVGGRN